jgi:cation diffusion facilitator family transporter
MSEPAGSQSVYYDNSKGPETKHSPLAFVYHHAQRAVVAAMVFNFFMAALKLGLAVTVSKSAALFSEGLHSLADGINSVFLLIGIIRGNRAPDRTHPFGYGLETNFWALIASVALFLSAFYAILHGVDRFTHPVAFENTWVAAVILLVSVVGEMFALRVASEAVLQEVGVESSGFDAIPKALKNIRHVVAPTTRFVFYEDGLALLGAFVALISVLITELMLVIGWLSDAYAHLPDAIASMIIGGMLLILALNLLRYNRGFLIGSSAPALVEKRIEEMVTSIHGVSQVTDLKTIDQGLSGLIVHLKVEVEPDTQVKDVDDLTDRIKDRIQSRMSTVRQVFIEVLADETEEEWGEKFEQLIEQGKQQGVLKPREEMMLKNLYEFTESVVSDIMVPRTDVEYLDIETPLTEVADLIIETGHSRLPVFEEHVDNIVGVIQARDVYRLIRQGSLDVPLREILREIDIYPENKPVSDLLEDFKRNKIHVAAVADEHGGFSGLVTIEDLLEEIVGELWDEHEVEETLLQVTGPNKVLVSGKVEIEELNEQFAWNIPSDDFKTLGGFVFGQLGREPEQGDVVMFEELSLTVTETEGPRIKTITIETASPVEQQTSSS